MLIILQPIDAWVREKTDAHQEFIEQQSRAKLAAKVGVAVLLTSHFGNIQLSCFIIEFDYGSHISRIMQFTNINLFMTNEFRDF